MAEHHFNIDSTQVNPTIEDSPAIAGSAEFDDCNETAHLISNDAWYQAGFVLVTSLNSVFALGYSGIIMVPLGWIGGTIGLVTMALLSLYANHLLARLHEIGGRRHIRYRDLAGHIYGRKMYYITWTLQYINLFMANIGFIIFAGQAIKVIYSLYTTEALLKLPYCITIGGLVCIIFAYSVPHLSGLRLWLVVSTILSLIYIITSIVLSIKDGVNSPARDYGNHTTKTTEVFSAIGATASLAFAYNSGMLPEIQATLRAPYVKNMQKALYLQFTVGIVPLYIVTFVGYWAYGSSTSSYLLANVTGSKWVKTLANAATFLQTMITLHIFASPTYEYLDTKFGWRNESIYSMKNWAVRLMARGTYLGLATFMAALLPFLGDFVSLTSAVTLLPLTFVLANHMYIKVKGKYLNTLQKSWHWANICFFTLLSVAGVISAIRQIAIDSKTYHAFANL